MAFKQGERRLLATAVENLADTEYLSQLLIDKVLKADLSSILLELYGSEKQQLLVQYTC